METKTKNVPYHIGVIMDGNRRWAKRKGFPTFEGHRKGLDKIKEFGKWCKEKGVKILTLYTFSTENWNRSKEEIKYLMNLLKQVLGGKVLKELNKEGIKVKVIGQRERLDKEIIKLIKEAEELTKNNKEGVLNLAISYGGRAEIVNAVKEVVKKNIPAGKIDEKIIEQNLWTKNLPDPDLIIRTAGEQRLSGFLTWQSVYSEFYFSKKYWPEFSKKDFEEILSDYSLRQRRFGK